MSLLKKWPVLACGLRFGPKDAISWPLELVYALINVPSLAFQQLRELSEDEILPLSITNLNKVAVKALTCNC